MLLPVANASSSYWRTEPHALDNARSTEQLPAESDIVIIGAGMSGVSLAYSLLRAYEDAPKPSITILEARELCSGATGRNGGHIKYPTATALACMKRYGVAAADELIAFVEAQIGAIKGVVEREGLDCEFELRRSFDVFLDQDEADSVTSEFAESVKNGEKWTRNVFPVLEQHVAEITSITGARAAFSVPACSLWPYKFVSQLLARIAPDVNIQTHTPVTSVTHDAASDTHILRTPRGQLRAKRVVFATNAYTAGILPACKDKIIPYRGHASHVSRNAATATAAPLPHLVNTYNITYSPQLGTDYLNPRPDGNIIVGGAKWTYDADPANWDNVWDDATVLPMPRAHFDTLMPRYFRGWAHTGAKVDMLWSGIMGRTPDGMPFVGRVPNAAGQQFIIAGFNGGGMPLIFLAAQGLAKVIKDDVPFGESGIPSLFEPTAQRFEA